MKIYDTLLAPLASPQQFAFAPTLSQCYSTNTFGCFSISPSGQFGEGWAIFFEELQGVYGDDNEWVCGMKNAEERNLSCVSISHKFHKHNMLFMSHYFRKKERERGEWNDITKGGWSMTMTIVGREKGIARDFPLKICRGRIFSVFFGTLSSSAQLERVNWLVRMQVIQALNELCWNSRRGKRDCDDSRSVKLNWLESEENWKICLS